MILSVVFFRFGDPDAFEKCFINWTQSIAKVVGSVIALDGKTICNLGCGEEKTIHLVSAFSVENDLVLGQLATDAKSNEITAFLAKLYKHLKRLAVTIILMKKNRVGVMRFEKFG